MEDVLTTAGGVLLAFFTLRLLDWVKEAPRRARQRKMHEAMAGAVDAMFEHLSSPEHQEHIKQAAKKPRRKPAVKKAPAKKGATNAKAKARG